MISPAHAHGSAGVESSVGFGPLIFLAVEFVVVAVLSAEKKWRKRKRADIGR